MAGAGAGAGAGDGPPAERFDDPGWTIHDLTVDDVLVVCPSCAGCARVVVTDRTPDSTLWWARRLACPGCGLARDRRPGEPARFGDAVDPFFGAPLWLQEPCCGEVLWAFHAQHLELLRGYVGARLRARPPAPGAPRSVLERLPAWLTSAKHRAEVLRAIDRLQRRLPA